jgi:hypothetical protein
MRPTPGTETVGRRAHPEPRAYLDAVLCGGRRAAKGDRALFVTALGENQGRMLAHLRLMRFLIPPSSLMGATTSAHLTLDNDG